MTMTLIELFATGNFKTDKGDFHSYLPVYDAMFASRREHADVLEIGVFENGSMRLWESYFSSGTIVGIDIDPSRLAPSAGRLKYACGNSRNRTEMGQVLGNMEFDIIIDDGDHTLAAQAETFAALFGRLKVNGYYVIEDVSPRSMRKLAGLCPGNCTCTVMDRRNLLCRSRDDILVIFNRVR